MALIVCKKCGRKISDTVNKCIHCGEDIVDDSRIDIDVIFEKQELIKPFANLTEKEKEDLVIKYWCKDSKAQKYYKGRAVYMSFANLLFLIAILFICADYILMPILMLALGEFWCLIILITKACFFAFLCYNGCID